MLNVLKILDNPIDDIPLVSVLRSEIGNFTDNEILEIRLCHQHTSFYDSLLTAKEQLNGTLQEKIEKFLDLLQKWRVESDYLSLAELVWKIYTDTGFYYYVGLMPNGALRQANLKMLFERAKEYEKTSFKGLFYFIRFIERLKVSNGDMSSAKIIGENENVVRIMSIHKSKGLEFPIVFLSSTAKQMNLQDLNAHLLLHQTIGIGPEYMNYHRQIQYSTAAKEAIKIVSKTEAIAEEMRVLYVALTRAKEKIIITGIVTNYEKSIEQKKDVLRTYQSETGNINPIVIKKYTSYLDWLMLVFLNHSTKDIITIHRCDPKEILEEKSGQGEFIRQFDFKQKTDFSMLEQKLNWQYPHVLRTKLPIKSTVSKIKQMQTEGIDFEKLMDKKIGFTETFPNFVTLENETMLGTRYGTLMHLFLQRVDFHKDYSIKDLEVLRQELIKNHTIKEEEAQYINLLNVQVLLKSALAKKIQQAKIIEKEKAFCMQMSASEAFKEAKEGTLLVQGIIDLYCIDNEDNIILVDYKTDCIQQGNEKYLVDKYQKQLMIYQQALENALHKKVTEVYIYSLHLNKAIKL